ncbi:protein of unknown function (DUF4328) [Actinosynnema pretiosum]|uniref:DUF4328 domain-containing protein n=2 Tax=Pseudonocardiaceae TaxID=2070 RepID=UPI0031D8608C|nr:protein of unknown function (DUF4328) [Actinosynnema pretiosum]
MCGADVREAGERAARTAAEPAAEQRVEAEPEPEPAEPAPAVEEHREPALASAAPQQVSQQRQVSPQAPPSFPAMNPVGLPPAHPAPWQPVHHVPQPYPRQAPRAPLAWVTLPAPSPNQVEVFAYPLVGLLVLQILATPIALLLGNLAYGLVTTPLLVLTTGLLPAWCYRARLATHDAPHRFSPGMAAGGWFIPLANFYVPARVVLDLVRARDRSTAWTAVVLTWWGCRLLAVALVAIAYWGGSWSSLEPNGFLVAFDVLSLSLQIAIVLRVTAGIRRGSR